MRNAEGTHLLSADETTGVRHVTVLLQETIDNLAVREGDVVFDGTLGGGGHAYEMVRRYPSIKHFIGTDLDPEAIARTKIKLAHTLPKETFAQANFRDVLRVVQGAGEDHIDRMILDLGVSTFTFEASGRGFSFQKDEPLAMTFGEPEGAVTTARDVVNEWEEESLVDILRGFGEEKFAHRIAKGIIEARQAKPITTSRELADIVRASVPGFYRTGKIHPATKTFQAIRIAVNDELGSLEQALRDGWELLAPKGRIAVISFHSLEDRIVKRFFKEKQQKEEALLVTKRPITPANEEIIINPRSRSAKLRIIEKL